MKATFTRLAGTIEMDGTPEEIAAAIKALESQFQFGTVFVPSVWQVSPCQHEYPEGPWLSVLPPACKKCGSQQPVTSYTTITADTPPACTKSGF